MLDKNEVYLLARWRVLPHRMQVLFMLFITYAILGLPLVSGVIGE
jgi:hypothetical protein